MSAPQIKITTWKEERVSKMNQMVDVVSAIEEGQMDLYLPILVKAAMLRVFELEAARDQMLQVSA